MPNLKDIKTRITSVKKTRQITSAMKLVAAAKLKRATEAATAARPYKVQLAEVLQRVSATSSDSDHPLMERRDEVRRIAVVVITSDRGLCGGFNNTLLRRTGPWMSDKSAKVDVWLKVFGRKGTGFFSKRGNEEHENQLDWSSLPKDELVSGLCENLVSGFIDGDYDEAWIVYNEFVNALTQTPTYMRLLPMSIEEDEPSPRGAEYRYEPDSETILGHLLPLYVRTLVLQTFLESEAGEHAARMTAMDNATRNASDLIDALTLEYNRARQAAITKEIIEIVSGAQALE